MKTSSVLGLASTLIRGRKYQLMLVGVQFAYLGYKYLKKRKRAESISNQTDTNRSLQDS